MDTVQNLRPRGTAKLGCFQIFGTNIYLYLTILKYILILGGA